MDSPSTFFGDAKLKMRRFYIVFFIVNLLLCFYYVDVWNNSNTTSRALPIVAFFENGTMRIDKYHELTLDKAHIDGHYYTDKAPLPTFFVMPFFGLIKVLGLVPENNGSLYGPVVYVVGSFLCGSIPFVLYMLFALFSLRHIPTSLSPVLLVMMPFYGSFLFVFSGTYFPHVCSAFLLLLSYLALKDKRFVVSGIFSGLAFLSEYTIALVFPVWAIQVWIREKSFKKAFAYGAGTIPAICFILIYNYIFTGSPFEMLYKYHTFEDLHTNYGFNLPTIRSVWGLSFSSYKGLFFYTPFLVPALFLIFRKYNIRRIANHYITWISLAYFIVVSGYFGWWGGWTYGPRLLFPVAVLVVFESIIQVRRIKFPAWIFWVFTSFGFIGAFLAKITVVYSVPTESYRPFIQTIIPALISGDFNPNNLLTMVFGTSPMIAAALWLVIFGISLSWLALWYKKILNKPGIQFRS